MLAVSPALAAVAFWVCSCEHVPAQGTHVLIASVQLVVIQVLAIPCQVSRVPPRLCVMHQWHQLTSPHLYQTQQLLKQVVANLGWVPPLMPTANSSGWLHLNSPWLSQSARTCSLIKMAKRSRKVGLGSRLAFCRGHAKPIIQVRVIPSTAACLHKAAITESRQPLATTVGRRVQVMRVCILPTCVLQYPCTTLSIPLASQVPWNWYVIPIRYVNAGHL
jgi:hypothetical protein